MEQIFQNASDKNVVARKVYVKTDGFAYVDEACKTKILTADLHDAFIKGMLIVDAASGNEYKPISCAVASDVATVTYVTTDSTTATTAKLATAKSVKSL